MARLLSRLSYETSAALVWVISKADDYFVWVDNRRPLDKEVSR